VGGSRVQVAHRVAAGQISSPASRRFAINACMSIIAWIVVSDVVRSGNRDAVHRDERDLRIQHASNRAGSGLMAVLIIGLISALATLPEWFSPWLRPLSVANALGLLITTTLTECAYVVVRHRREHA
jgi:hypothetical protein